jgi:hypothetical protein
MNFKLKTLKTKMRDAREQYRAYRASLLESGDGAPKMETVPSPPITTFVYEDTEVFGDVSKLILLALQKLNLSQTDRERAEAILTQFLPEFFFLVPPSAKPAAESAVAAIGQAAASGTEEVDEAAVAPAATDTMAADTNATAAAPASKSATMEVDKAPAPTLDGIQAVMTKVQLVPANVPAGSTHLFYASSKWYGFHALHQILYE